MKVVLPSGHVAIVDDADIPRLEGRNWHADPRPNTVYVRGRLPGQQGGGVYLHAFLMGGLTDHIDGDGLNCRRSNLRRATQHQNSLNRRPKQGKRFKGVFLDRRRGTYYAQVGINGNVHTRSGFLSEEAAARAHDELAARYHGSFARLNLPCLP